MTSRPSRSAGARPLGQVEAGVADRVPDAVGVERVLHHRVADPVAAADAAGVADHDDLRLVELDARGAGGDRGEERRSCMTSASSASRSRRARPRCRAPWCRWRGPSTRGCARSTRSCRALGVADGVDGQQRGLGLHVVHVGRVGDAGRSIADLHGVGDLLDHRDGRPMSSGSSTLAHREADGQPRLVGLLGLAGSVSRRSWRAG